MTVDSVLQSGQTEAGDFIAAAGNGEAGTVLVQFWPHLPESLQTSPDGHTPSGTQGDHAALIDGEPISLARQRHGRSLVAFSFHEPSNILMAFWPSGCTPRPTEVPSMPAPKRLRPR